MFDPKCKKFYEDWRHCLKEPLNAPQNNCGISKCRIYFNRWYNCSNNPKDPKRPIYSRR